MQTGTQTQPGLPATSSSDAEIRGASRGTREAIFLCDLGKLDFGLKIAKPKLWTDSSAAMQASKRIGPGTKLRHLDVSEFYITPSQEERDWEGQRAVEPSQLPHQTSQDRHGCAGSSAIPCRRVNIKVAQVSKQPKTWKPQLPAVAQSLILASCVTGAGAQGWNEVPATVRWEAYILLALLVAAGFERSSDGSNHESNLNLPLESDRCRSCTKTITCLPGMGIDSTSGDRVPR